MPAIEMARLGASASTSRMSWPPLKVVAQLLAVGLAVWAGGFARKAPAPVQEAMRAALSLSDNQLALMQGPAVALAIIAGALPVGLLVDRYSRVRVLLAAVTLDLAGCLITAAAPDFHWLFVGQSVVGLAEMGSLVAAFSLIADLSRPEQRGRASMVISAGSELASPAAFALGGSLLVRFGASADGWRWALFWMCVPPLSSIVLLMLWLREPARTGVVEKRLPVKQSLPHLWRYRTLLLPILMGRCTVWVADGATVIWATPLLARNFGLKPDQVGHIMAAVMLATSILSALAGGFLADLCQRFGGPRTTLRALSVVAAISVPTGFFACAPSVPMVAVGLAAFILLGFVINMVGSVVSTVVVPNEFRGTFLSLTMLAGGFFGVALAPMLVSWTSGALGGPRMIGQALTIVCVTFSALAAATFAWGSRRDGRV